MNLRNVSVGIILVLLISVANSQTLPNHPTTRREALGSERAGHLEAILQALQPQGTVVWSPELAIRDKSGTLTPVDVHDIKTVPEPNGGRAGLVAIDLGSAKKQYIERLKHDAPVSAASFSTDLVLFHLNSADHVTSVRTIPIDKSDPVTKLVWYEIESWPSGGLPIIRLSYESYIAGNGQNIVISWVGRFDTASGSFLSKIPNGIEVTQGNGQDLADIISAHRTSPGTVQFVGAMTKRSVTYQCSDPCVVNTQAFLALWPH